MEGPAAHDRIERFMLDFTFGGGDEPVRLQQAFRAHLAEMVDADLPNSDAVSQWRAMLSDYFDAAPGEGVAIHAATKAMLDWPEETRDEFLIDIGNLTAIVTPPGWRRS